MASLLCLVFAVIYAQFSHGVFSPFMSWMFVIPLVAGAAPACVFNLVGIDVPASARKLWALAIATFSIASCLRGIFEIAGTGSPWLYVYVVAGALLAVSAVLRVVVSWQHMKGKAYGRR